MKNKNNRDAIHGEVDETCGGCELLQRVYQHQQGASAHMTKAYNYLMACVVIGVFSDIIYIAASVLGWFILVAAVICLIAAVRARGNAKREQAAADALRRELLYH